MVKKFLFLLLLPFVTFGQSNDFLKKGDTFFKKSVNDSAVYYYEKGIKNCNECSELFLAKYYLKFGRANQLIGNRAIALSNFLKAEKEYTRLKSQQGLFEAKTYLGDFYRSIESMEKSFQLIEEAENIRKEFTVDKKSLAFYYNRRAAIVAQKFDDKEKVIELSKKCITAAKEANLYSLMVYSYNELAYVYEAQHKSILAREYYFKALEIAKKNNLEIEMCDVLFNIGREEFLRIEYSQSLPEKETPQLYQNARNYFKQGLELATKIKYLERQKDFSKRLYHNYVRTQEFEEAMKYNQMYNDYNNQILINNKQKEIAEIEANYLVEKKDNQIKIKENEIRRQYVVLIAFGLLLMLLFFYFVKSKKDKVNIQNQKSKIEEILAQKTMLLKEIHHRIKNNLQLTSSLLFLQSNKHNDPKISAMVHESQKHINSIALVHEMLYQEDTMSLIAMDTYLKELGNRLLQFSPDKNITYNLEIENISLPIDYATTLGLILNELVTNSLKYAFKSTNGVISVSILQNKARHYELTYSDNGIGLSKEPEEYLRKTLGVKLIKMLAEEIDAQLEVINKDGLTYRFIFKNKYEDG